MEMPPEFQGAPSYKVYKLNKAIYVLKRQLETVMNISLHYWYNLVIYSLGPFLLHQIARTIFHNFTSLCQHIMLARNSLERVPENQLVNIVSTYVIPYLLKRLKKQHTTGPSSLEEELKGI